MKRKFISNTVVHTQKDILDDRIEHYGIYAFGVIFYLFIEVLLYCLQAKGYIDYIYSLPLIAVSGALSLFCLLDYSDYRKLYFKRRFEKWGK